MNNNEYILAKVERFAKLKLVDTPKHHGISHVQRVVKNCRYLAKQENLTKKEAFFVEVAAWLHDVGRSVEKDGIGQIMGRTDHALKSKKISEHFLVPLMLFEDTKVVLQAIIQHTNRQPADSIIGRVLQDGDKLDGIGEIGIKRAVLYRTNLSLEDVDRCLKNQIAISDPIIGREIGKLINGLKWVEPWIDWFNTKSAKEIARPLMSKIVRYRMRLERLRLS